MPEYNCEICGKAMAGYNRIWVDRDRKKHLVCNDCSGLISQRVDEDFIPEPKMFNPEYWNFKDGGG